MNTPSVQTSEPTAGYYIGYKLTGFTLDHGVEIGGILTIVSVLVARKLASSRKRSTTGNGKPSLGPLNLPPEKRTSLRVQDFCLVNNPFRNFPENGEYTKYLQDAGDEILYGQERSELLQAKIADEALPIKDRLQYLFEMKELELRIREVGNAINSTLIKLGLPEMEDLGGEDTDDDIDIEALLESYREMSWGK